MEKCGLGVQPESHIHILGHYNLNFGLTTKVRAWKDVSWECNPKVTFTLPGVTILILGCNQSKGMERCGLEV